MTPVPPSLPTWISFQRFQEKTERENSDQADPASRSHMTKPSPHCRILTPTHPAFPPLPAAGLAPRAFILSAYPAIRLFRPKNSSPVPSQVASPAVMGFTATAPHAILLPHLAIACGDHAGSRPFILLRQQKRKPPVIPAPSHRT